MKFIVGLGNPTDKYKKNRHNVGFLFIDYLINNSLKTEIYSIKRKSEAELIESISNDFLLVKPLTYMNLSGRAILYLKKKYNLKQEDLMVVYDDIDFPFGLFKIKDSGSSGGHKGVQSIIDVIGKEFLRLRIGIGRPIKGSVVDYVLSDFSKQELSILNQEIFPILEDVVNDFIEKKDASYLMNKYNKK